MQAGYIGPLPLIQDAPGVDKELCTVVYDFVCYQVADSTSPDAGAVVPLYVLDLVAQLDVFGDEVVFALDGFEVRPDLGGVGVVVGPELDLPGELVVDGRYITCASWVLGEISVTGRYTQMYGSFQSSNIPCRWSVVIRTRCM